MTNEESFKKVDGIYLSQADATDCKICGLRYFVKCQKCGTLYCTWCTWDEDDAVDHCTDCRKKPEAS